ncbi:NUDIX domain-containing protein [Jatrophihabitans telluris]|uniref:NUDIX domain-containing protein n=1 Tax=Jatrophihabitans telluris TaxID=2038343 RepID=A0ABY4QXV3_9ACTN|nr:NUDIX domain-containing protein [Jatrophihabitans telluris]UQX88496.1 NUDIX domain-containing protein [Jatrophihabitans telluris]
MTPAKPTRRSAGLLLFRRAPGSTGIEVLIAHTGGPFWAKKDTAAWSIPKGEYEADEPALDAARREFTEELGLPVPDGEFIDLGDVTQKNGKIVTAWALEADLDPAAVVPGTFSMELPRGSGRFVEVPEVDRVAWFTPEQAGPRLFAGQSEFLDRLLDRVSAGPGAS